ncbi:accessory factor associated with RNA polymerase II, partial [Spiromyces aspiralis]
MTASKDPLTLLREFTIASKSITLLTAENQPTEDISQAKTIKFNDQGTFSRDEPTTYKKKGKDDTYTLGSLIFFLRHKDESFYTYIKSALEAGVPGISFTDKGDL